MFCNFCFFFQPELSLSLTIENEECICYFWLYVFELILPLSLCSYPCGHTAAHYTGPWLTVLLCLHVPAWSRHILNYVLPFMNLPLPLHHQPCLNTHYLALLAILVRAPQEASDSPLQMEMEAGSGENCFWSHEVPHVSWRSGADFIRPDRDLKMPGKSPQINLFSLSWVFLRMLYQGCFLSNNNILFSLRLLVVK